MAKSKCLTSPYPILSVGHAPVRSCYRDAWNKHSNVFMIWSIWWFVYMIEFDWNGDWRTAELSQGRLVHFSQHMCLQEWSTLRDVNGDRWCDVRTRKNGQPGTFTDRDNIDQVDWCRKVHLECVITNYYIHLVYNLYQGLWEDMDKESQKIVWTPSAWLNGS